VLVRTQVRDADQEIRVLTVVAENVSSRAVDFELPNRCPAGPLDFEGLPSGFDAYGTCNAGACPGPTEPIRLRLEPGARRELATARLALGGSSCTPALPPGAYRVRPVVPALGAVTCVETAAFEVRARRAPAPQPPMQAPAPIPQPPEPPPAVSDPYACSSPSDCVLSCPRAPGCCGWPCGCNHAIRRDHAAQFEASYASTCQRAPRCPAVGCAYQPAMSATCRMGRCVGTSGLGP
jgi:hypothetical protein